MVDTAIGEAFKLAVDHAAKNRRHWAGWIREHKTPLAAGIAIGVLVLSLPFVVVALARPRRLSVRRRTRLFRERFSDKN